MLSADSQARFSGFSAVTLCRIHGKHLYLNLSHEGLSDIDTLRNLGLINALKITSETYIHSTAFRLSARGFERLGADIERQHKLPVQKFVSLDMPAQRSTGKSQRELLCVKWDPQELCFFLMGSITETRLRSSITDVEELSYVMSPHLPKHLMLFEHPSTSFLDFIPQLAAATKDEKQAPDFYDITMRNVRLLLSEWVPMGGNAVVALNDRLGVSERVQGGFFTAAVDSNPRATLFRGGRLGLTSVRPLDYETFGHVNFEAEVFFETPADVIQVESFSVHCSESGHILFGGRLDATTGCLEGSISLDVLSRLLIDICIDSSKVLANLFDSHQADMLSCVLLDEPEKRNKYSCVLADSIQRRLDAHSVLEDDSLKNKVKQVVGDIRIAEDIDDAHLLVVGRDAMMLVGPNSEEMEPPVVVFCECQARSVFLKAIFSRCYIVVDIVNQANGLLQAYSNYPEILEHVRAIVASASEDILLLQEVQRSMLESIMVLADGEADADGDAMHSRLKEMLKIPALVKSLKRRTIDLQKTITACVHDLQRIRQSLTVIEEAQRYKLNSTIRENTQNLEELFRDDARSSTSLEIINIVFAGSLAFNIVDRMTGSYLGVAADITWLADFVRPYITTVPFAWLGINLLAWALLAGFILLLMRISTYQANRLETLRQRLVVQIDCRSLRMYLYSKNLKNQGFEVNAQSQINKYGWIENPGNVFGSVPPKFELEVDERYAFLLSLHVQVYKRRRAMSLKRAQLLLLLDLYLASVIDMGGLRACLNCGSVDLEKQQTLLQEAESCWRAANLTEQHNQLLEEIFSEQVAGKTSSHDEPWTPGESDAGNGSAAPRRLKNRISNAFNSAIRRLPAVRSRRADDALQLPGRTRMRPYSLTQIIRRLSLEVTDGLSKLKNQGRSHPNSQATDRNVEKTPSTSMLGSH
uniref:Uncharacterized protein n=1 Tax=Tetraselmis sp. GSL018 TaxID=582737 RepID=A0A061SEX3_9CHLO|mmetsp:Transcript_31834/g.75581  ORF Transcript_31834/g.75581 Transcript_31834/m.75581 type:complete len:927 (+) Transcript_31834:482-3262(+)|eukprot:CAMPEP_0177585858 /NCGR_PEP_ID=MMETSP0419_2-20121207/4741_1 /TAXON_ID=582737 /ORGANISM="Tetraselmis sp., Strain GSL018" /LENGTH=926 /DNA_ID=CAMNT_0019075667 /DNA_START=422 /DNA_END=3202 /DNA_ORIENTATION=-